MNTKEEHRACGECVIALLKELESPQDAAVVIMYVHFQMWMNYNDGSPPNVMLADYASDFMRNYKANLDA